MHPKFITEVCHICEKKDTWLRCWFRRSTDDQPPPYQSAPNDQFPTSCQSAPLHKKCSNCGKQGHLRDDCWFLKSATAKTLKRQVQNDIYTIFSKNK